MMSRDGGQQQAAAADGAPSPSTSRFENSHSTQRKLQQYSREKNILLSEVQSLKQQLRATNKLVGLGDDGDIRLATFDSLLSSNLKSGTLACVFALKLLYTKRISPGFHKWRLNARLSTLAAELSTTNNHRYSSQQTINYEEDSSSATLRLLNARRLAAASPPASPARHRHERSTSPFSSSAASAEHSRQRSKPRSPGSTRSASTSKSVSVSAGGLSGSGSSTPRYLSQTKSSRANAWGFYHHAGLLDATDQGILLLEGTNFSNDGGNSPHAQVFSPVREREKRRSKSSAHRNGSSGGGESYMAPTSSALKKMSTPGGSGEKRDLSRSMSPTTHRSPTKATPTADTPGLPSPPLLPSEVAAAAEALTEDNRRQNVQRDRRKMVIESGQLKLLMGEGENLKPISYDDTLRRY